MHRLMISGAALAALLAGAAPALATTPTMAPVQAVAELNSCGYDVAGSNVNLRSGAGTRHASLGHLTRGDQIDVDRHSGGWYRVTLSERSRSGIKAGTTGWVAQQYLKPSVCMQLDE